MTLPIYQVDAFSNKIFGGNPAAVVPLKDWLHADQMQAIAAENNVSETAFFVPIGDKFEIRWFTPTLEIDLCGHATLASAHILWAELGYKQNTIHFATLKAGSLEVSKKENIYTLDFPSRPAHKAEIPDGVLEAMGGVTPTEVYRARDFMFVYESETIVNALTPDFSKLKAFDFGVIATAKGDVSDFVSRFFIPSAGVDEDPVTGSTHCNLIPFWAERLQKNRLHAYQISKRKGELFCELKGDRVLMSGNAVTYLKGEISS